MKTLSKEHRLKISLALKGKKKSPEHIRNRVAAQLGENHPQWKGDKVGYVALHEWVRKQLGEPKVCTKCGSTTSKKYEWANKSGLYKRDILDWIRLCTSCHRVFDKKKVSNP